MLCSRSKGHCMTYNTLLKSHSANTYVVGRHFGRTCIVDAAPKVAFPNLLRYPLHEGLVHFIDLRGHSTMS